MVHLNKSLMPNTEKYDAMLWHDALNYSLVKLNIKDPVLLTYLPQAYKLIPLVKPRLVCYDCVDSIGDFSWAEENVRQEEVTLLAQTDLAFASAEKLFSKLKKYCSNVIFLPNAVDYAHFSKVQLRQRVQREKVKVGFVGALYDWIDIELLKFILTERPEWQLVAIGPSHGINMDNLQKHKNFHWLGSKEYQELPKFMAKFDVCIIPFLINEVTENANPIKMWEYMATGLPIVSTDIPEVRKFSDIIYIARDKKHFVEQIETALGTTSSNKQILIARANDWSSRVRILTKTISEHWRCD